MPVLPLDARRRQSLRLGLGGAGAAGLAVLAPRAAGARILAEPTAPPLAPTPAMTEGPLYPPMFQATPVRTLRTSGAPSMGRPMLLAGRIVDTAGRPVEGARIEIWQCDARGHYHHPRDTGAEDRDPGFAGFGWQLAAAGGSYEFETIEPVPYPGRTPHVHVRVRQGARVRLTSQVFLPDRVEDNGRDFLWRALGRAGQPLASGSDVASAGPRRLVFDLVVAE
jgi:protocatechuate 3,4-dioxygenase beta subunit